MIRLRKNKCRAYIEFVASRERSPDFWYWANGVRGLYLKYRFVAGNGTGVHFVECNYNGYSNCKWRCNHRLMELWFDRQIGRYAI
jgi:hypothetical protein